MQDQTKETALISPRDRVNTAIERKLPDRTPVDFLAVPKIWNGLIDSEKPQKFNHDSPPLFNPSWEQLLQELEVDCRVISYDQFCNPPDSILNPKAKIDWYSSPSRSTPNRMWRQITSDNQILDIWGRQFKISEQPYGTYEVLTSFPLNDSRSLADLKMYAWPEPDWWDFTSLPRLFKQLDIKQEYHLRYRIGSVFEVAW